MITTNHSEAGTSARPGSRPARRFLARVTLGLVALATVGIAAVPAASAEIDRAPARPPEATRADLSAALQRDLGLSAAAAARLATTQSTVDADVAELKSRLGATFAGVWVDPATGRLHVATTSNASLRTVGASATAHVVKHNLATLTSVTSELDAAAANAADLGDVVRWAVEPQRNAAVVTVREGASNATVDKIIAKYGDAVVVEQTDQIPVFTADYLDGGDAFNGCSVGFNGWRAGSRAYLTAGHCGTVGTLTYGTGGNFIGRFTSSWFPTFDDAVVRVENTGYWIQGPWVEGYSGGGYYNIHGYRDSIPGTAVCKSGKKTGFTCGRITAINETVNYGGQVVYGLTRHSACVEKGDSGGSNFSWSGSRNYAEGMTSGAVLYGATERCGAAYGLPNTSWFQPVADSIAFYGFTLWTAP